MRKKHGDQAQIFSFGCLSTGLAFCRVQATHGQFVAKKTLADFDKLEKEIKAEVVEQGIASLV